MFVQTNEQTYFSLPGVLGSAGQSLRVANSIVQDCISNRGLWKSDPITREPSPALRFSNSTHPRDLGHSAAAGQGQRSGPSAEGTAGRWGPAGRGGQVLCDPRALDVHSRRPCSARGGNMESAVPGGGPGVRLSPPFLYGICPLLHCDFQPAAYPHSSVCHPFMAFPDPAT